MDLTKYTKERLIASDKFAAYRDILSAILEDGRSYTVRQTERALDNYLGRKVN